MPVVPDEQSGGPPRGPNQEAVELNDSQSPKQKLQLNPEILKGVRPLDGLEKIVVVVERRSMWVRGVEEVSWRVMAAVIFAGLTWGYLAMTTETRSLPKVTIEIPFEE
jgi:hypothetical protein